MDIDKIKIEFKKHYKKESLDISPSVYYNFYPVVAPYKKIYKNVEFTRKDALGYIKLRGWDYFLYDNEFQKVHCDEKGFTHKQPQLVWIQYLREPTFVVYKTIGYANVIMEFLVYKEIDDTIKINWSQNINDATVFHFEYVLWSQKLVNNKFDL